MAAGDFAALGIDLRERDSGTIKTLCPECSHTRRNKRDFCLSVDIDSGLFNCHHCGWGGKARADRNGYGSAPKREYKRPNFTPSEAPEDRAVAYLRKRGIPIEVAKAARISFREAAHFPQSERPLPAICFPYYRDGEIVNVKYRGDGKVFRMEAGAELTLYGLDGFGSGKVGEVDAPLYWAEGEIDALSLVTAGCPQVVSVPNGAPSPTSKNYARHFDYLAAAWPALRKVRHHILAVDADEPGQVLAAELTRRLGPAKCSVVAWPEGHKDANEVLVKLGVGALQAALAEASPTPVAGLYDDDQLWAGVYALHAQGETGGAHPGSPALARYYTVKPGQWTLVTGIPGHGKSALLDWLMVNIARDHGWRFAVCSPENQPLERHAAQLIQIFTGKPFRPGSRGRMSLAELQGGYAWLRDHFSFILPPADDTTLDRVLELAAIAIQRHGINGLVIDPWNELDHTRIGNEREDEHISRALATLRRFARDYAIHVWLVAHPTKLPRAKGEDGGAIYAVPTPYDVSGGAHFRNKADMALAVYRGEQETLEGIATPTEVHIQKVRFAECGRIGKAVLWYDRATGRYHDSREGAERREVF